MADLPLAVKDAAHDVELVGRALEGLSYLLSLDREERCQVRRDTMADIVALSGDVLVRLADRIRTA
ncbi:MAG: hypothetical protein RLY86_679 [Pseudomonadota bacterium]|jgi:hypothetical protein